MQLNHEGEYICVCERWDEPVLYPVAELIRCRECKYWQTVYAHSKADYGLCQNRYSLLEVTKRDGYCHRAERKE